MYNGGFMKLYNASIYLLIAATLVGLSGCARYKAQPLKTLMRRPKADQSLSFEYKAFTTRECVRYLGRNVLAQGYQPIQITFTNNTDRYIRISPKNFSFASITPQEVAQRVHTNTAGRAIGYGVAGLFIWPFLIPAVVDSIGSAEANEQLDADFSYKALRSQTIKPYSSANGIIFAASDDFDESFTFTVIDQESNQRFMLTPLSPTLKI